jgi:uncharacterized protein (DUF2147 family)
MRTRIILTTLCLFGTLLLVGQTPIGTWKTIDDETNEVQSHVEIYEQGGKLYGKVVKLYRSDGDTLTCYSCDPDDARYGKRLIGMVILKDLVKDSNTKWDEGEIMDPNKGETYDCLLELEGADKLKVRGFISTWLTGSALGRTQYWYRVKG